MFMRPLVRVALLCTFTTAVAIASLPAAGPKPAVNRNGGGDLAVHGYDVVAYASGEAVAGTPRFEHRWNAAVWRFSSAENRARFARDPEKYAPQFGGYCAWAVSRGYTANIDPEAFRIVDGKLYLNYSRAVQRRWEQDIAGNVAKAQSNWPGVLER